MSDQTAIWRYLQQEAPESFDNSRWRLSYLATLLPPGKVLNIGIGGGFLEDAALRRGAEVYSLDPIPETAQMLKTRLGISAIAGYSQSIPFTDSYFDAVVASELLEHLEEPVLNATLEEICRVLVPGGTFIGTVPAREVLSESIVVCPCCGERFHRMGHHHAFTSETITQRLEPLFRVQRVQERTFVAWQALNWKGKVEGLLRLALNRVGVHGRNENIVFVARRSQSG